MNRIKAILVGACIGSLIGSASAATVVGIGTILIDWPVENDQVIPTVLAMALFSLSNGLFVGGLSGALGHASEARDYGVFRVLLSISVASIYVMAGGFDSRSTLPLIVYGLAILNGVIVAPIVAGIKYKNGLAGENQLVL